MPKLWLLCSIFIFYLNKCCFGVMNDADVEYANQRFKECCLKMGMSDQCAEACAYNQTEKDIEESFTDGCPMGSLKQLFVCASNFKNNTDCCERNNLFDDNRESCRMFCEPQGAFDWPQSIWDVIQFLQCEAIHDRVFQCHLTNANYTKRLNQSNSNGA
uniref:Domain of unknown function DB domain-containing protein n=1 Tax=Romanomermis culicivorax TaxID=13658 RepID=A0A915HQ50_ROMCU